MKRIITIVSISLLLVGFVSQIQAEEIKKLDKVVVTATRTPTDIREIASSTTIISQKEIKNSKAKTVSELLRTAPALDVAQSGGLGKNASAFIRGANSEHTLVLLDGININDPMSVGRSFDFAHLLCDDIEKIEIIRGPQSTLYGSDALGGVINIITKKGKKGFQAKGSLEAGTYNTFKENLSLSGATKKNNYFFNISRIDSQGFSTAAQKYNNTEDDGYKNTTFTTNLGTSLLENLVLDFMARYIDFETDVDNGGGPGQDDINHINKGTSYQLKSTVDFSLLEGVWKQLFALSYLKNDLADNNASDNSNPLDYLRSSFKAKSLQFNWQNTLTPNDYHTIIGGFDYEKEKGSSTYYSESAWGTSTSDISEQKADIKGFYLQDQLKLADKFYPTVGVRHDKHSKSGNKTTYKISQAFIIDKTNTKIKGSYGTGFKSPSLYQLYSIYGDEELKAEKSEGYDIGLEQFLLEEKLFLELIYFYNEFKDLINYDYITSRFMNIGKAEARGVEFSCIIKLLNKLTAKLNYTYTKTKDKDSGEELLRRAKNKAKLNIIYNLNEKTTFNLYAKYIGKRKDIDAVTWDRIDKGSYTVVDFITSYDLNDNIQIFAKVLNLFNKSYEEVDGYGTSQRAFYGGIQAEF